MYQSVRETDRIVNTDRWPMLFFPEIYVMKGGYSEYYKKFGATMGTIEIPYPQLNKSQLGYTKMKEHPPQSYWVDLESRVQMSEEQLIASREVIQSMYNSMLSYNKKARD